MKSKKFFGFMRVLKRISENPALNIIVGLTLLYSGISETVVELKEIEHFKFGVHHGVIFFALLHILKNLPDLFEGLEHFEQIGEEEN